MGLRSLRVTGFTGFILWVGFRVWCLGFRVTGFTGFMGFRALGSLAYTPYSFHRGCSVIGCMRFTGVLWVHWLSGFVGFIGCVGSMGSCTKTLEPYIRI